MRQLQYKRLYRQASRMHATENACYVAQLHVMCTDNPDWVIITSSSTATPMRTRASPLDAQSLGRHSSGVGAAMTNDWLALTAVANYVPFDTRHISALR
jgi:hypothetical protein